jgi:transcriptional regulator with XRE-family HTH domain
MPTKRPIDKVSFLIRFGKRLRDLRISRNLTQEDLAAKAGFSRSYYTEIETGKRNVSLINLAYLADSLEINLSTLLSDLERDE